MHEPEEIEKSLAVDPLSPPHELLLHERHVRGGPAEADRPELQE
jgi:hypothetical protein